MTSFIALIMAALRGLSSLEVLVKMLIEGNVVSRLKAIEDHQKLATEATIKMAESKTPEERKDAVRKLAASWFS